MSTEPQPTLDPSSFFALVTSLGAQCKILLGLIANPLTGKTEDVDTDRARTLLRTLEMLEAKTRGNLDENEQRYLGAILADLRMRWVEKANGENL